MAILLNKYSKVIVQGLETDAGRFHTKRMIGYGTNIAGGVTSGQGGTVIEERPVFDSAAEAVRETKAETGVIFYPAQDVKMAAVEGIQAGLKSIIIATGNIPKRDMMFVRKEAAAAKVTVLGGNSPGIITPGEALAGVISDIPFRPGNIGIVSRSVSIMYYAADMLTRAGYGESSCIGLGADAILGATFDEILWMFEKDHKTQAVLMIGEIGGKYEEQAVKTIKKMKKPVVAMIAGVYAPPGRVMGHAGAMVEGKTGGAGAKLDALSATGINLARTFMDIPEILKKLGIKAYLDNIVVRT
ncbi:succinyl-CoA synthetase, NAD(P)-binding, alpha subunit [Candidatus Zixiibacteriota bacterium]|nr:succinyl-CoA synthetase, NAD(P)-binding, alpha subunit [candidate division Zixibacteria bacterium]